MALSRKGLYEHGGHYYIVVSTCIFNTVLVPVINRGSKCQIKSLFIEEGYADIAGIVNMLNPPKMTFVRILSDGEYIPIVYGISSLMLGDVVWNEKYGAVFKRDAINPVEDADCISNPKEDIEDPEEDMDDPVEDADCISNPKEDIEDPEEDPPIDDPREDAIKLEPGMYSLAATDVPRIYSYTGPKKKRSKINKNVRYMYTADEVIDIASTKNIAVLCDRYGIDSYGTMASIKDCAKKLLGIERRKVKRKYNWMEYFKNHSIQDAIRDFPDIRPSTIRSSYTRYLCNANIVNDENVRAKYSLERLEKMSFDELLELQGSSINDFVSREHCSYGVATSARANISFMLSINPMYLLFRTKWNRKESLTSKTDKILFDLVKKLEKWYVDLVPYHQQIFDGDLSHLESIPEEFRNQVRILIRYRFVHEFSDIYTDDELISICEMSVEQACVLYLVKYSTYRNIKKKCVGT